MRRNPLSPEQERARRAVLAIIEIRGLRQVELARAVGMIPMAVSTRLNGKVALTVEDLFTFAEALEVTPEVLLQEPEDAVRLSRQH